MPPARTVRPPAIQTTFFTCKRLSRGLVKVAALLSPLLAMIGLGVLCRPGLAEERYREFVRQLQDQGYADMAVEYLRLIAKRSDLPDEDRDAIDLEMGKSIVLQSEGVDAETERKLLDEASGLFGKFLAEHKDSDDTNEALAELAGVFLRQGQRVLAKVDVEKDAGRRTQFRGEARKLLGNAKDSLATAAAKYRDALNPVEPAPSEPPEKEAPKKETKGKTASGGKASAAKKPRTVPKKVQAAPEKDPRIETAYLIARLNLAIAEFYLGKTYDVDVEAEKNQRKAQLNKSADAFDELFQEYRGSFASFVAHLWHGRALEEQGDLRQAVMIYDEVLVNEPPTNQRIPRDQASLFTQAEVYRLSALNRQGKHDVVTAEAEEWLKQRADRAKSAHGVGVQLELAKAFIGKALQQPKTSRLRKQNMDQAFGRLNGNVTQLASPYQDEGFRLKQKYADEAPKASETTKGKGSKFDEFAFAGETAFGQEKWPDAVTALEQALASADPKTDEEELDGVKYRLGFAYYRSGDFTKAATFSEELARQKPQSKLAPNAAGVALVAHSGAYAAGKTVAEKEAAMDRILELAKYIEEKWPDHSQADAARRTVGSIMLYRREFIRAAETYSRVTAASNLHAEAQTKTGQAYWSAYLAELARPEAERDKDSMTAWLASAKGAIAKSLQLQKTTAAANAPMSAGLVEAQLLSAEIELKTGAAATAAAQLEPLVPVVRQGDRGDLNVFTLRILLGAMEAAIAQGDLPKAEGLLGDLEKQGGGDANRVTQILIGLGRGLEQQLRQHEAAGRKDDAEKVRKSFETFLERLAARSGQTFYSLQYLAESYFALGNYARAAESFGKMIETAKTDPALAETKNVQAEIQRVRLRRATALKMTGQFAPALAEVDALIKENSRLLAALMERGRVLQDWGAATPAKYAEAAVQWDKTSKQLQGISPRPAEYYEARHGVAYCLAKAGRKDDAIRVLRSTMNLSPDVGGPEIRIKYEALLKQLDPTGSTAPSKAAASGPAGATAKQ